MGKAHRNVFGGGAFGTLPGTSSVDGFAIDLEPIAQFLETTKLNRGDGAVGFGANIEEQVAVFADDIDEEMDEIGGGNRFGLAFGTVIAERAAESTALFPLFGIDLRESFVFGRSEIVVRNAKAVIDEPSGTAW